jgi:4'-phosphopantetheinyl transferase
MLGCDVEVVEPRSDAFVADYFTSEEQAMIRQAPDPVRFALIALIWSAKESALKALSTGLRSDTRSVSVTIDDSCLAGLNPQLPTDETLLVVPRGRPIWRPVRVNCSEEQVFHGWWFCCGGLLRTMVSDPATEELTIPEPPAAGLPLPGTADHDHAAGTRALTTGTIHTA